MNLLPCIGPLTFDMANLSPPISYPNWFTPLSNSSVEDHRVSFVWYVFIYTGILSSLCNFFSPGTTNETMFAEELFLVY